MLLVCEKKLQCAGANVIIDFFFSFNSSDFMFMVHGLYLVEDIAGRND